MANTILEKTYVPKIDLTTKVGLVAVGTTDAKVQNTAVVTVANGTTDTILPIGIITDGGLGAGTTCNVAVEGFTKAIAGGAITAFAPVKADVNGALVVATLAGDKVVGIAQEAVASGAKFDIKVQPFTLYHV